MALGTLFAGWGPCALAARPLTIDADNQYGYATSLLDTGAHDEAIHEFNRFIYFFPEDARISRARYGVGMAHFSEGRYKAAASVFNALTKNSHEPEVVNDAFFMLSQSHARQGMIEQAILDLHNLIALTPQEAVIARARYELGWLHVDSGQWSQARRSFAEMDKDARQYYRIEELNALLSLHDRIPSKSPHVAGALSLLPGAGQAYCGRYQDALTAFLINAGLILSAWEAFDNELYALGGVIGLVEAGFYGGNIYSAVSSANKFNRDRIAGFRQDLYRHREKALFLSTTPTGGALCLSVDF